MNGARWGIIKVVLALASGVALVSADPLPALAAGRQTVPDQGAGGSITIVKDAVPDSPQDFDFTIKGDARSWATAGTKSL